MQYHFIIKLKVDFFIEYFNNFSFHFASAIVAFAFIIVVEYFIGFDHQLTLQTFALGAGQVTFSDCWLEVHLLLQDLLFF